MFGFRLVCAIVKMKDSLQSCSMLLRSYFTKCLKKQINLIIWCTIV